MASPERRSYDVVDAIARAPQIAITLERPRIARGVDLADVEAALLAADDLDDVRRMRLLRDARCLAEFYAGRSA